MLRAAWSVVGGGWLEELETSHLGQDAGLCILEKDPELLGIPAANSPGNDRARRRAAHDTRQ